MFMLWAASLFVAMMTCLCTQVCPIGYSTVDQGSTCYKVFTESQSRSEAIATCALDAGVLAIIENHHQNQLLQQLKAEAGLEWMQIGLRCHPSEEACWYWDGERRATYYTNWEHGQLEHDGQDCRRMERCAGMGMHGNPESGTWHDCPCDVLCSGSSTEPFACMIDSTDRVSLTTARPDRDDREDSTCLDPPEAAFTCSDHWGETCCPGTRINEHRCGDCCGNLLIILPVVCCALCGCISVCLCCCKVNMTCSWKIARPPVVPEMPTTVGRPSSIMVGQPVLGQPVGSHGSSPVVMGHVVIPQPDSGPAVVVQAK